MKSHRRLSSPVNFLKPILSDDTGSTGIRIPEKFTEKHGKDLSEKVMLKVRNGDEWAVDLKKSKGEIWLKDGWGEFAEHYGIKFGHLLVFKYEGFSIFGVIIFNASASEIVDPNNSIKKEDDAKETPVSCHKLKTVKSEDHETSSSWSQDHKHGSKIYGGGECSRKKREDARKALEKAKANYKCDKPFFMVYMHRSYVTRHGVGVPVEFRRKLLRGYKKHRKWLLQLKNDGGKKTWEVIAHNACLGNADWIKFVKDNGVTVGDICVFELIHKRQYVLGVTILRSAS